MKDDKQKFSYWVEDFSRLDVIIVRWRPYLTYGKKTCFTCPEITSTSPSVIEMYCNLTPPKK